MRTPMASANGQCEVRSRVDVARRFLREETSNPEDETSVPTSKRNCKAKNRSACRESLRRRSAKHSN
jgi:hypothetical protein